MLIKNNLLIYIPDENKVSNSNNKLFSDNDIQADKIKQINNKDSIKIPQNGKEISHISFVENSNADNSTKAKELTNITYGGPVSIEVDEPEQPLKTGILFNSLNTKDLDPTNGDIKLGIGNNKSFRTYVYSDLTKIKNPDGKGSKPIAIYQVIIVTNPGKEALTIDIKGSGYPNTKNIINKFTPEEKQLISKDKIFRANNPNPDYQYQNTRLADMKLSQDFTKENYTVNQENLTIPPGGSTVVYTKVSSSKEETNIRSSYDFKIKSDTKDLDFNKSGLRVEAVILDESDMKKLSNKIINTSDISIISQEKYNSVSVLKNQYLCNPINENFVSGTNQPVLKGGHPGGKAQWVDEKGSHSEFFLGRVNGIKSHSEIKANIPDITLSDGKFSQDYKVNTIKDSVSMENVSQVDTLKGKVPLNSNNKAYGNYHIKYNLETNINNLSANNQPLYISFGTPNKNDNSYKTTAEYDKQDKNPNTHSSSSYTGTIKITIDNQSSFVNVTNNRIDTPDLLKNLQITPGKHKVKLEFVIPTNSTGYQIINLSQQPPTLDPEYTKF